MTITVELTDAEASAALDAIRTYRNDYDWQCEPMRAAQQTILKAIHQRQGTQT